MEQSEFYREVRHRAACLQVSVNRRALKRWCDSPEHGRQLREIYRGTVPFMLPPEEGRDQIWRREAWAYLEQEYPEALKQLLSLAGIGVLKRQAARGDLYAGAVLHSLLKGWLQEYDGPGCRDY
ncbi:hypothetical protein OP853_004549 [Salmonella enterica]|nr:hypothetical protein [Salmonella enterica]EKC7222015.1 hypothetical protein [Salmonella enterica]